ncbi:MAG: hypothetical protein IPN95_03485 [Bacteroidetes bacterium]|nr:hypothetical protein [Bacteroidota bacterium]
MKILRTLPWQRRRCWNPRAKNLQVSVLVDADILSIIKNGKGMMPVTLISTMRRSSKSRNM